MYWGFMSQILMYIKDKKKETQILKLCERMGVSVRLFMAKDVNKTIGELTGMSHPLLSRENSLQSSKMSIPFLYQQPDIIIFHGLSDQQLDQFLDEYRKDKIEPTPLKAVVTMHNLQWSVYELTQELLKEAKYMKR